MPELPEVEALRRSLLPFVVGSKIKKVQVLNQKIIAGKGTKRVGSLDNTVKFTKNIIGKKIIDIKRRAKNLIIVLESVRRGEAAPHQKPILLVHLKMTGQLVFVPKATTPSSAKAQRQTPPLHLKRKLEPIVGGHPIQESENKLPHKHTYIIFELENGTLYYNDIRQFGYVLYFENENILDQEKHFENIGVEPFDKEFTQEYFEQEIQKLKKRKIKTPIKKILLDQKIVVGCGNIYCDEVLWASGVLPTRPISTLSKPEIKKIYKNILNILDKAINSGGSSVANYLLADGKRGNYADYHRVYQKQNTTCTFPLVLDQTFSGDILKGKKVRKCAGIIQKINLAGRGTHFCPKHQK